MHVPKGTGYVDSSHLWTNVQRAAWIQIQLHHSRPNSNHLSSRPFTSIGWLCFFCNRSSAFCPCTIKGTRSRSSFGCSGPWSPILNRACPSAWMPSLAVQLFSAWQLLGQLYPFRHFLYFQHHYPPCEKSENQMSQAIFDPMHSCREHCLAKPAALLVSLSISWSLISVLHLSAKDQTSTDLQLWRSLYFF